MLIGTEQNVKVRNLYLMYLGETYILEAEFVNIIQIMHQTHC